MRPVQPVQPVQPVAGPAASGAAPLLLGLGAWVLTAAAILSGTGSRMLSGLDEGIYLTGASRLLAGSVPYRDFLSFVGPAIFLEYAAALGIDHSLLFAHFVLAVVIGLTSGVIVYLSATAAGRLLPATAVAVVAALLWLGTLQFWRNKVYVDHRWESTAMTLLAFALAHAALRRQSHRIALLAGCALGAAVIFTPSAILFAGAVLGYLLLRGAGKMILTTGCGFAIPPLAAAVWLLSTHSMGPFFNDMLWAFQHYPQPNTAPYGYISAGEELAADRVTWLWLAYLAVLRITAALPVVAGALLLVWLLKRRSRECAGLLLVLGAAVAMVSPRFSADHLLFACPIAIYCIARSVFELVPSRASRRPLPGGRGSVKGADSTEPRASASGQTLYTHFRNLASGQANRWILYAAGLIGLTSAGVLFIESDWPPSRVTEVRTALGTVVCRPSAAAWLQPVLDRVTSEDSLFVYPYFPLLYALTGARNPSTYLFLQPGMMGDDDMAKAARELRADLPKYIVRVPLPEAAIRRYWPGTQRITSTGQLDEVVAEHYRRDLSIPSQGVEVFLRK